MLSIKKINLEEWTLSGGGQRGDSYFNNNDSSVMVKFDNTGVPLEEMAMELENGRIAASLGLPTPDPGELVTDGTRYGITFRRIQGKESYARMVSRCPEQIPELAAEFASVVKRMHSTPGKDTSLRNIKSVYGGEINANPYRSRALIDRVMEVLNSLPDGDTCIHGDLHYGNVIRADGNDYLIDLGNFSYGYPYFDFGMMMAVDRLGFVSPEVSVRLFHCTPEQGDRFWECFLRAYFGPESVRTEVEKALFPYYAVRLVTMESESGLRLPDRMLETVMSELFKMSPIL